MNKKKYIFLLIIGFLGMHVTYVLSCRICINAQGDIEKPFFYNQSRSEVSEANKIKTESKE